MTDRAGPRLERVTPGNVRAACGLMVRPDQDGLVAPVARSLAEAYASPELAWPRLIYDGDELAGFVMAAFGAAGDDEFYRAYLWRLNIAAAAQRRGYGRFAVSAVAAEARRRGHRKLTIGWKREHPRSPEPFYLGLGFRPTGEIRHGEICAELALA